MQNASFLLPLTASSGHVPEEDFFARLREAAPHMSEREKRLVLQVVYSFPNVKKGGKHAD